MKQHQLKDKFYHIPQSQSQIVKTKDIRITKSKSKRRISSKNQNSQISVLSKMIQQPSISVQFLKNNCSQQTQIQKAQTKASSNSNQQSNFLNINQKRQTKTARPVSRKRFTSKDKYTKTTAQYMFFKENHQKQQKNIFLKILNPNDFIQQKQEQKKNQNQVQQKIIRAFWAYSHKLVSLFPIEYTECINFNHKNILPVFGQVTIKQTRYIVSNQYKHSTLKQLINQFGPFSEHLSKIYLMQILNGLQQMHQKKMAHNRLRSQNILYNKEGQVFINIVKSSSRPLNDKEKKNRFYQFCPQILHYKSNSNSFKNDVWSIGILLLDMLINLSNAPLELCKIHPYNSIEKTNISEQNQIIIDNLKQIYPKCFQIDQNQTKLNSQNFQKIQNLSKQCKDFIKKCLSLNKDDRPNIKDLKVHSFMKK